MSTSQKVEQEREPTTRDQMITLTKQHVEAMESTNDELTWVQAGMHHLLLRTIGRRSRAERKVALPFWRDPQGHRIVVASFGASAGHPSWYLNLADKRINPRVLVGVQTGQYWSVPEVLDGYDYLRTWSALTADRSWYHDYQTRTDRRIPLVRLAEPKQSAAAQ